MVVACLFMTWVVWGSMYKAIDWAQESFPPLYQMGTQFLVASVLLGGWALLRGQKLPSRAEWVGAAILGTLMLACGFGLTAVSEASVASGLVVVFNAVVPTLIAVGELPYGKRPSLHQLAGIVIGLAGIVLLSLGQGFSASLGGLLAIAGACVAWTTGSLWATYGLPGGRPLVCASGSMGHASQMLVGGALLLALSWMLGETPKPVTARAMGSWAYVMLMGMMLSYIAYLVLLERTSPTLAASYTYVNPVVALAIGVADGEKVTGQEWFAAAIVLVGVILLVARPRPHDAPRAQEAR
jgi:drug/metabolite transporter (DMT)-like permease